MMTDFRTFFILMLSVLGVLAGCNISSNPEERETIHFSVFETEEATPIRINDRMPISDADRKQFDMFSKNAAQRFDDPELEKHIDRIESIYISSGRFLELLKLYEDEYKKEGLKAKMVERLAFAYINLGQFNTARNLLDTLLAGRPESASLRFLEGSYWMRQPRTLPNLANALKAYKKVLILEPNFKGFESIDAAAVRQLVQRLEPNVPPEMLEDEKDSEGNSIAPPAEIVTEDTISKEEKNTENPAEIQKVEKPSKSEMVNMDTKSEKEKEVEITEPRMVASSNPTKTDVNAQTNFPPEEAYLLNVAKAEIAISDGRFAEADAYFNAAKKLKPEGFEAIFGPLRAKWRIETARNKIAVEVRKLSKTQLNAKQAYQLGLFVYANMSTKKLARDLFETVKKRDPTYAKRVGIDALLEKL